MLNIKWPCGLVTLQTEQGTVYNQHTDHNIFWTKTLEQTKISLCQVIFFEVTNFFFRIYHTLHQMISKICCLLEE